MTEIANLIGFRVYSCLHYILMFVELLYKEVIFGLILV